ncbi:hypothetical protein KFE98_08980 [bacterium SCSIO 12741]|nr:hypothetical protein KFE98_08980 [bacterium SCSIO 12741]
MTPSKVANWFYYSASVALLTYVIIRLFAIPITHDEAFSFLRYVHRSYLEIFSYNTGNILPNNHILNTLGMKFFSSLFGVDDWVVRIPNVIGFAIYLVYAVKLAQSLRNRYHGIFLFVALTGIHYLVEFFALARGYGLSLAFLLPALYYLRAYLIHLQKKHLIIALGASFLSIEASFTLLYLYLPLGGCLFLWGWIKKDKWIVRSLLGFLVTLVLTLYEPLRFLISSGTLFGPKESFVYQTVFSLALMIFPDGVDLFWIHLIMYTVVLLFFVGGAWSIWNLKKAKTGKEFWFPFVSLGLILTVLLQVVGAALFDRNLLSFRTALYFYPLFFYFIALFLDEVLPVLPERFKRLVEWPPVIIAFGLIFNFALQVNTHSAREWKYEENSREVYQSFKELQTQYNDPVPLHVGITWLFEPSLNFYRVADPEAITSPFNRDGLSAKQNYFYVIPGDTVGLPREVQLIKEYSNTGNRLYRRSGQ